MKKISAVLLCTALILTSGCVAKTKTEDKSVIATSFYPIYIFTLNLTDGIDELEVKCMAEQNTGCLHDYTVTSKDARLLNDCSVFVINGAGMEGFTEDLYDSVENLNVIDSSENARIICGEHGNDEAEHHHKHNGNSHIWLSVKNAIIQVENIAEGLKKNFPQYAKDIEKNCKNYILRLNEIQTAVDEASPFVKGKKVIAFHNAYEYLAEDMGFSVIHTIESDENGEPSAKKLAQLTAEVKNNNVCALFTEPQYSGSAANILSSETDIPVYILNPVLKGENVKTAYEDIMKDNIEIILKAVK